MIGDLTSPFKVIVELDYKTFGFKLQSAIHMRFGLPASLPITVERTIKRADRASAHLEAV